MSIIAWLILGLISGFIASKIVSKSGEGFFVDVALGIAGAVVGGFLASALLGRGVTGLNLSSVIISVIGAIIVLWVYHAIRGRTS